MSVDEYNRVLFERMHSERRWENEPATGWSIEDLDVVEIRNTVAEAVRIGRLNEPGHREPEHLLRGLGLLRDGVLVRAAAVLFGNTERLEFEMPQCLLRVARFRGIDRTEFLDNRQFNGNAFMLLSSAERFLRESLAYRQPFRTRPDSAHRRTTVPALVNTRSASECPMPIATTRSEAVPSVWQFTTTAWK